MSPLIKGIRETLRIVVCFSFFPTLAQKLSLLVMVIISGGGMLSQVVANNREGEREKHEDFVDNVGDLWFLVLE